MRHVRKRVFLPALAAASLIASGASAAPVTTDDTDLTGPDGVIWDAQDNYDYGSGGPCYAGDGFTPIDGGTGPAPGNKSDAFDGGLYFLVGSSTFNNNDEPADLTDNTLTVGPKLTDGLQVTRIETALQDRPTLRSLVKLTNPTGSAITRTVVWDSALGADESEATRATSSGDTTHTKKDRWVVASDDAVEADLSDPPVTFVFSGKGASESVANVRYSAESPAPVGGDGQGCISVDYEIKIPAKKTRYMLFFTELHDTNASAIQDAPAFNSVTYNSPLLDGLTHSQKANVLNWRFTCKGRASVKGNHILGTNKADELTGTSGRDVICSANGTDQIEARGGDDLVLAGGGNDLVSGGGGNDVVRGGGGKDGLFGNFGKDKLYGNADDDDLNGGAGADLCKGGGGKDSLKNCEN